jgi:hypothetical protein
MSLAKNPLRSNAIRTLSAAALVAAAASLLGCPPGMCLVRVNGQCAVDTCPEHAALNEANHACGCKAGFVTFNGACITPEDANQQCGTGNQYANGGCVAITCPQGQILNATSGRCESRAQSDALVAKAEGKELKAGQSIGCPGGFTYVFNGNEGACIPNDAVCGVGTRYENGKCTAISCPPGQVFDLQANSCAKLATGGDQQTYSIALKLKSAMGPDFCSPHAKNPGGFGVSPGQTKTVRVTVTISVPGNSIDAAQVSALTTTDAEGNALPASYSGVGAIQKQVNDQVLAGIKALGGKSVEPSATASVDCKITRAPVQVISTQGGGV